MKSAHNTCFEPKTGDIMCSHHQFNVTKECIVGKIYISALELSTSASWFKHILFITRHDKGSGRAKKLCLDLSINFFINSMSLSQSRPASMGLWDSLNCFAIFTQPPYAFDTCLASSSSCLFTYVLISRGNPQSKDEAWSDTPPALPLNSIPAGFEPSPIQHLPAGNRNRWVTTVMTKLTRLPQGLILSEIRYVPYRKSSCIKASSAVLPLNFILLDQMDINFLIINDIQQVSWKCFFDFWRFCLCCHIFDVCYDKDVTW